MMIYFLIFCGHAKFKDIIADLEGSVEKLNRLTSLGCTIRCNPREMDVDKTLQNVHSPIVAAGKPESSSSTISGSEPDNVSAL